jgi:CheY-like chemotaxis protein
VAKILVADDNSNIQKMVVLALKDQGIDVVAVGNGEAAVRKISDIHPDLVLADVFMPVRNGYEVCQYVKNDPKLSHIPVILLVGAFDPLDEQEAQRVAADGVLKKPFVPPDPLISMVKSALTRAGVSLGPAPAVEKPVPAPSRPITELFHAASSKAPAVPPVKVPEAMPEPLEEFTLPKPPVKFGQGQEPVAFGSLLDTPEEEEATAVTAKPMISLTTDRKWDEESDEVHEEEDEENSSNSWRASSLNEEVEKAAAPSTSAVTDWRDEVLQDSSSSGGHSAPHWTPAPETPAMVEAAEVPSVAVSTIENTPVPTEVPFAGDDWAAAIAAGVQEKLTEVKESSSELAEVEPAAHDSQLTAATPAKSHTTVAPEETQTAEPANWAVVPEMSWEVEAKRASMLASTWDAPAIATPSTEETQDISSYAGHVPEAHEEHIVEHATESVSAYSGVLEAHEEAAPIVETHMESAGVAPVAEETEHIPWETDSAVQAGPPVAEAAEEAHEDVAPVEPQVMEPAASAVGEPQKTQPDMDELVARVLQKMSPEVISRVTQEILKPVIEALVRDELHTKKS